MEIKANHGVYLPLDSHLWSYMDVVNEYFAAYTPVVHAVVGGDAQVLQMHELPVRAYAR
jgi:hypothetical protein